MVHRLAVFGVAVVVALGAAACSSDTGSGSETSRTSSTASPPVADGDVYLPPDPLPAGAPGEVIWGEEIDAPRDARAWRVLYHSETLDGEDVAVSGVVVAPDDPAPEGGRPVVSWAHGTAGIADACAPSKEEVLADVVPSLDELLDAGYVVAATDYEGLGTPGVHPFLVGASEGRGVLDAARAAAMIDDTGANDRVAVWGHSQGGHAALFAGQIAPEYAPDLDVVGVAAGAPVGNLPLMLNVASQVPDFVGFIVLGGYGFAAAYPDADPEELLTAEAAEEAVAVEELCVGELLDEFNRPVDEVVARNPLEVDPWPELLEENTPGGVATEAPLFVFQGTEDMLVPPAVTEDWYGRSCELGSTVELAVYDGADHEGVMDVARTDILSWITDRFAGAEVPPECVTRG